MIHESGQELHNHRYKSYPGANLPLVLNMLEIKDNLNRLQKDDTHLPKTKDWEDAKKKLVEYEGYISDLKKEIDLHKKATSELSSKVSKIQLRNSLIGLILIIISAYFGRKLKKENS